MQQDDRVQEIIYRTRGYLPHVEKPGSTYFVTLRLAGTLPQSIIQQISDEVKTLEEIDASQVSSSPSQRLQYLKSTRIQDYLDQGIGTCFLKDPAVVQIVQEAIEHHDGVSYVSHVACVMPNHLHWILTPLNSNQKNRSQFILPPIIQRFKSFTAHAANKLLHRSGPFWSREYYDHRIRSSEEFGRLVLYIIENPIKAKLCSSWQAWPWTFLSTELKDSLTNNQS
jgi:REP element-mobilizing transposase RayT